jgi:hypothetical protein
MKVVRYVWTVEKTKRHYTTIVVARSLDELVDDLIDCDLMSYDVGLEKMKELFAMTAPE